MPVADSYRPDPRHLSLGPTFFDPVRPAEFPQHRLRWRNDRAAATVGLDTLTEEEWIGHFGRLEPLPDNLSEPLALRYHGHQFRAYNPDIGDGRGFLFAQMRDASDRLVDLGTKGTGTTPYSRSGDGRLTLKGAVRELLATEALEALGVPTSRTFSIVETGEKLWRGDEPSPTRSAALVRMQRTHVRIGTFQRLAFEGDKASIRRLVGYCAETYGLGRGEPVAFLREVIDRVADTGAAWWVAGFVHGVLNTDNIVVTGDSFDYGPWRFLEAHDPGKVAAYFDQTGLYAFARQPEALSWNLTRLAECLLLAWEEAHDGLVEVLEGFASRFEAHLVRRTHDRLGLLPVEADAARERVRLLYRAMRETAAPHHATLDALAADARPPVTDWGVPAWQEALAALAEARRESTVEARTPSMAIGKVEALWDAIASADDWSPLYEHVHALRRFGAARAAAPDRANAPTAR